jgi:hypothetical protein
MQTDLDELTRVVGTMPRDLVREVLAFARYLERKHARTDDPTDWEDDYAARYGLIGTFADAPPVAGGVRDRA